MACFWDAVKPTLDNVGMKSAHCSSMSINRSSSPAMMLTGFSTFMIALVGRARNPEYLRKMLQRPVNDQYDPSFLCSANCRTGCAPDKFHCCRRPARGRTARRIFHGCFGDGVACVYAAGVAAGVGRRDWPCRRAQDGASEMSPDRTIHSCLCCECGSHFVRAYRFYMRTIRGEAASGLQGPLASHRGLFFEGIATKKACEGS